VTELIPGEAITIRVSVGRVDKVTRVGEGAVYETRYQCTEYMLFDDGIS